MIASGMTNSSIPLAENLHKNGYDVGYFQLLFEGTQILDLLELDTPLKMSFAPVKLSINNVIYNYLSKDVPIFSQWVLKERKKLEKTPFGNLQRKVNRLLLRRLCKKYICGKYDIVNVIAYPRFFVEICDTLNECKVPFFVTFHEIVKSHSDGYEILPFVNEILKYETKIVLHSNKSYNDLLKLSTSRNLHDRCVVIPFGSYEGNYICYGEGKKCVDEEDYLLFFGNILPYKGLDYLYDAIIKVGHLSGLKIIIAGNGSDPILMKMKKDDRFIVLNRYVLNEELAYLIKHCRAVVCPYIGGSQSGVSQLAMAYNKPIIASNVGAFRECVINGRNGWLVEPKNPDDLCEKIKIVYQNDNCFDSIYIPEEFSWSNIIIQYKKLFQQIG